MSLVGPSGAPLNTSRPPEAAAPSPQEPPVPRMVTTAFLVYADPTGRVLVTDQLDTAIIPSRQPTLDDIIGMTANVQAELTARKTANMAAATTIQTQMAIARQSQQGMPSADEAEVVASLMQGRR